VEKKHAVAKLTDNPLVSGADKILLEIVIKAMNWLWESSSVDSIYGLCDNVGKQLNSRTSNHCYSYITLKLDNSIKCNNKKNTKCLTDSTKIYNRCKERLFQYTTISSSSPQTDQFITNIREIRKWHKMIKSHTRALGDSSLSWTLLIKAGNISLWATMITIQHRCANCFQLLTYVQWILTLSACGLTSGLML